MYKSGHFGTSLLLYAPFLALFIHFNKAALAGLGLIIIVMFSSLPDIDFKLPKVKHRGYSHSLVGAVLFALPIGVFGYISYSYLFQLALQQNVDFGYSPIMIGAFTFVMGYFTILTHYAGDIVTPSGIPILAPYKRKKYSLSWFYAKNRIANGAALFLGIVATILALLHPIIIAVAF